MNIKVTCSTTEVLERLRTNRKRHASVFAEAREAYRLEAIQKLSERLEQLRSGEVVKLTFKLRPPVSHLQEYDTIISMLELHREEHIELSYSEVQRLIEDNWDWMDDFARNSYDIVRRMGALGVQSSSATLAKERGVI